MEGDRAALAEPGEDDSVRRDAGGLFPLDEGSSMGSRAPDTGLIHAPLEVHPEDFIPGGHDHPAVDRDWNRRSVGEEESDPVVLREPQLGDDRREVVPAGAESVEPDDRGIGGTAGLEDNAVEEGVVGHGGGGLLGGHHSRPSIRQWSPLPMPCMATW